MFLTLHNYDSYWLCVLSFTVSSNTSYTFVSRIGYRFTVAVYCVCFLSVSCHIGE